MESVNNSTKTTNKKRNIRIGIAALVVAALVFGYLFYVNDYYRASQEAKEAMQGNEFVKVEEEDNYYIFSLDSSVREEDRDKEDSDKEDSENEGSGIIFYPGGKVEETAYAPLMLELAELGYEVYLVKMPAKLAIFGMNRADEIMEDAEHIDEWIMMGHSLGGAMAASYSAKHDEKIDALVLLAAYSTEDLKEKEIRVYSFYGSEDKVLNMEKYKEYHDNLPEDVIETVIEGGNHAYYGYYGEQDGDGTATISREEHMEKLMDHFTLK